MQTTLKQTDHLVSSASAVKLLCVSPDLINEAWGLASPYIRRSYDRNKLKMPDDLLMELMTARKLLWLAVEGETLDGVLGAIVTGIYETADGLMCKALECGGDEMPKWLPLMAQIEQYAKAEGCGRVIVEGRPGWSRVLDGYRTIAVVLEKRI